MCASRMDTLKNTTPECPDCTSQDYWRNGCTKQGKQQYKCKSCGRVYVIDPYIPGEIRLIAQRMLIQNIPVVQITEVLFGFVSRRWIYKLKEEMNG